MTTPKKDYSRGKIYKIDVDGKLYVGRAIQVFSQRWNSHKKDFNKHPESIPKLYKAISERSGLERVADGIGGDWWNWWNWWNWWRSL
jgi:hypothetical protein